MNAFKNGVTVFDEDSMNELLSLQSFKLLYTGAKIISKEGAGVLENNVHTSLHRQGLI